MTATPARPFRRCAFLALAALCLLPACEEFSDEGDVSDDALNGRSPTATAPSDPFRTNSLQSAAAPSSPSPARPDATVPPEDSEPGVSDVYNTSSEIGAISWKGKNISSWPVTASLRASVSGSTVTLKYDKANAWPSVDGVCANAWAIVNINGKWVAGTFEYLRPGQTSKPSYTLDGSRGDHFKVEPLSSWRPRSGEVFGLMVSGLCRGGLSNVRERSNICIVHWP